eukprot:483750_1
MGNTHLETSELYIAGDNKQRYVMELSKYDNFKTDCLHVGYQCVILKTTKNEYVICGNNEHEQRKLTMIDFFTTNKIKISKIFSNVNNSSLFWLGTNGKIYASGHNKYKQLGFYDNEKSIIDLKFKRISDIKGNYFCCIAIDKDGNVFGSGYSNHYGVVDETINM